jgi:hypothetical protein
MWNAWERWETLIILRLKNLKDREHSEDRGVDGKIILE